MSPVATTSRRQAIANGRVRADHDRVYAFASAARVGSADEVEAMPHMGGALSGRIAAPSPVIAPAERVPGSGAGSGLVSTGCHCIRSCRGVKMPHVGGAPCGRCHIHAGTRGQGRARAVLVSGGVGSHIVLAFSDLNLPKAVGRGAPSRRQSHQRGDSHGDWDRRSSTSHVVTNDG